MLSLLKSDLYRGGHLRGNVAWYMIILLIFIFCNVGFAAAFGQIFNDAWAQAAAESGQTELTLDMFANFSTPTNFLGHCLMGFGLLPILVCFSATNFCWTEMKDGFIKNSITGVGKKQYFLAKLLFALVLSALFCVVGVLIALAMVAVSGIQFLAAESVGQIIVWTLLAILICWACACICLTVLWIGKNQVIVYLLAFLLATGMLSQIIAVAISFIPNAQWIYDIYAAIYDWLPRGAVALMNTPQIGAAEILGSPSIVNAISLGGEEILHIAVTSIVMIVAAYAVNMVFVRKRDF